MTILDNELYKNDVRLAMAQVLNLDKLKQAKVLITGATGLICSAIIDILLEMNSDVVIYAAGRSKMKIKERFSERVNYIEYDATKEINFDFDVDYIIHGASNASPELYVTQPVETMIANFNGIYQLLTYAKEKHVDKVIFISSSEVYGKKEDETPYKEFQYGYIDLLTARSSYAMSKRASETLCESFLSEYGVDYSIVRPGHIYGPSASQDDHRISSDFAHQAARGNNLVLKSEGTQVRSYCYSLDCASAILTVLTSGESGQAYNISNSDSVISIREMSIYIAEAGGVRLISENATTREKAGFNPMDNSSLNSTKLEELGWKGIFSAKEGLLHTVQILRDCLR